MNISHRAGAAIVSLCFGIFAGASGFGATAATPSGAAKPMLEDRAANSSGTAQIVARILDRWYPVASEMRQDVRVWRAQFGAILDRTSPRALRSIDAIDAKASGPNRTLMQLYQSVYSMAAADVGAQMALQMHDAKTTAKLGSATTDLVFVPITPCRIVDTRVVGPGLSAGGQRNLYFYSDGTPVSWYSQGGDAPPPPPGGVPASTFCPKTVLTSAGGTLGNVPPAAVMANITAVNTTAAGNFIAWGGSPGTIPNTSVLNWGQAGIVISNTTVIPWGGRTGGNLDFTVRYNGPSGFSDVVIDVMGYFIENEATMLDCQVPAPSTSATIATGTGTDTTIAYPACGPGYARTGGFCNGAAGSGTSGIYLVESGPVACVFRNLGGTTPTGSAISQCCRVPGR